MQSTQVKQDLCRGFADRNKIQIHTLYYILFIIHKFDFNNIQHWKNYNFSSFSWSYWLIIIILIDGEEGLVTVKVKRKVANLNIWSVHLCWQSSLN